jgi:hypothetical protein
MVMAGDPRVAIESVAVECLVFRPFLLREHQSDGCRRGLFMSVRNALWILVPNGRQNAQGFRWV